MERIEVTQSAYPPSRRTPAIVVYRVARGFTQSELAARAGIARQTLNRLERGRGGPRMSTARSLAAALEVDVEILFGEVGDG